MAWMYLDLRRQAHPLPRTTPLAYKLQWENSVLSHMASVLRMDYSLEKLQWIEFRPQRISLLSRSIFSQERTRIDSTFRRG